MNPALVKIDPDWREALLHEFQAPYFDEISSRIKNRVSEGKTIYPSGNLIFNAYNLTKPDQIKIVIIGQDPYHNPGEAMGLSFSVPKGVSIPPSLKNVYKELASDVHFVHPGHGDLTSWTQQGVFLLNAILTVEKNSAGSHRDVGWQVFTDATIKYLSDHRRDLVFMLWGNFAKNKKQLIDLSKHLVLESAHPSPLAGNAFQGCGHFSKANQYLISKNITPINWQI
ncbi:MAG: uracil-DNA glycosylase [Saprospiraceae bacterium]|nr:uracil-DNA glycosylase [Saprospiraceae bacterium]